MPSDASSESGTAPQPPDPAPGEGRTGLSRPSEERGSPTRSRHYALLHQLASSRSRMPRSGIATQSGGCSARSRARRPPSPAGRRPAGAAISSRARGRNGVAPATLRRGTPCRKAAADPDCTRTAPTPPAPARSSGRTTVPSTCPWRARVRRVVERAQHAGHVAQRRALDPPLAERPRRLALEVDDHEVVAGVEHLAEVVVAVAADAHRRELGSRASGANRPSIASSAPSTRSRVSAATASGSCGQRACAAAASPVPVRLRIDW